MKSIAILNGKEVKELKDRNLRLSEIIDNNAQNINIISKDGSARQASLTDRVSDHFETREQEMGGAPQQYNCIELEYRKKMSFEEYCRSNICLIVDGQIYEISDSQEGKVGSLRLMGETFYVHEKGKETEIETDPKTLAELLRNNYLNHKGELYLLEDRPGEIILKNKQYKISERKTEEAKEPDIFSYLTKERHEIVPGMEYEITYKETKEVTIRKKYPK